MRAPPWLAPLAALALALSGGCADDARIDLVAGGSADSGTDGASGGSGGTGGCATPCTGDRPHCFQGSCVECLKAGDCGSAELACDPSLECSPVCSKNEDCGDKFCDLGTQACVECRVTLGTADCGGEYDCVLGHCWECTSNDECETGQTCDLEEHHCVGTSG